MGRRKIKTVAGCAPCIRMASPYMRFARIVWRSYKSENGILNLQREFESEQQRRLLFECEAPPSAGDDGIAVLADPDTQQHTDNQTIVATPPKGKEVEVRHTNAHVAQGRILGRMSQIISARWNALHESDRQMYHKASRLEQEQYITTLVYLHNHNDLPLPLYSTELGRIKKGVNDLFRSLYSWFKMRPDVMERVPQVPVVLQMKRTFEASLKKELAFLREQESEGATRHRIDLDEDSPYQTTTQRLWDTQCMKQRITAATEQHNITIMSQREVAQLREAATPDYSASSPEYHDECVQNDAEPHSLSDRLPSATTSPTVKVFSPTYCQPPFLDPYIPHPHTLPPYPLPPYFQYLPPLKWKGSASYPLSPPPTPSPSYSQLNSSPTMFKVPPMYPITGQVLHPPTSSNQALIGMFNGMHHHLIYPNSDLIGRLAPNWPGYPAIPTTIPSVTPHGHVTIPSVTPLDSNITTLDVELPQYSERYPQIVVPHPRSSTPI